MGRSRGATESESVPPGAVRRSWTRTPTSGLKTTAPARPSTSRRRTSSWTWRVVSVEVTTDRRVAGSPRRVPFSRPARAYPRANMSAHTRAHFAQLHHIVRNCPETLNQRDTRGLTALHRAAFLAHQDGYLEIYEYLLVRETGLSWKEKEFAWAARRNIRLRLTACTPRARAQIPASSATTTTRTCSRGATRQSRWRWRWTRCARSGDPTSREHVSQFTRNAGPQPHPCARGEVQGRAEGANSMLLPAIGPSNEPKGNS